MKPLTAGVPELTEVELLDPLTTRVEMLGRLAALESASEHPLTQAVISAAAACRVAPGRAAQVEVRLGCGISGTVTWKGAAAKVRAGNATFAGEHERGEDPGGGRVL